MSERWPTWRRRLWAAGRVLLVLTLAGGALYWFLLAPAPVERHEVRPGEVVAEVLGTGTLEAHIQATVSTKIPGRLEQVEVDQGDHVSAGQVVARLDDDDLRHEVEIEEANVTARQAAVERLQAEIVHARASLDLASATETRYRRLLSTGSGSREEFDKAVQTLAVARADLSRAEAALAEGQKQLVAAQKALDFRKARLKDAVIEAPFAGIVVRRDRHPGDVVVPGSSILTLVSSEEMWVAAWVDETRTARLRPGQPARVVFRSEPDRPYAGSVVRLGRETDRETRETLVDVAPDQLPQNWSVGQRAEVYIETDRETATAVVPLRFLAWREGEPGVFVDADGRAAWRPVTLGLRGRETAEVRDGLAPGEVVLAPAGKAGARLTEGQRVARP